MATDAPTTKPDKQDDAAHPNQDGADGQHKDDPAKDPKEDAGHPDNTPAEQSWLTSFGTSTTWGIEAAAAYFNTTDKDASSHGLASESLWSTATGWVKNTMAAVDAISHFGFAEAVSLLPDKSENEIRALYNMTPTDQGDQQTATNLNAVERVYAGKDGSSATVKDGVVTHTDADGTVFTSGPGWMESHNGTKGYANDGKGGHQWEVGGLPGHQWHFEKNAKGDDMFTTADGDKARIVKDAEGHIQKIEIEWHDGRKQEITDKEVLNRLDRGIAIRQHRHRRDRDGDDKPGDDKPGDGEEQPANKPTAVAEQKPAGDIDVRDHGVIKVTTQDQTEIFAHADGRKEIHLKTGERVLIRPDGSYQVFDKDNNAIAADASNGVTVKPDGTLQVAGATVATNGVVSTKEGVVIAADSNQTTVKNSQGRGTFTTVTATEDGKSSVQTGACGDQDQTDDDPDQPGACKLDPNGKPITLTDLAPSVTLTGQSDVDSNSAKIVIGKPGSMDTPQFQSDDSNPYVYHMDPRSGESQPFTIDTQNNSETTSNGTTFFNDFTKFINDTVIDIKNMVTSFADGFKIDGLTGDLLGLNGDKLDSGLFKLATGTDGDDLPVAAHASAVAASATGIAGRVGGLAPAEISLGHVSELLGAYSELSAIKSALIAAGAFSAIAEVEAAQGLVNAQLGQAQIATVVQDISKQLGGPITNDALNQLFANSNGGDWQSIKVSMVKMGIAVPGAPELEQQPN